MAKATIAMATMVAMSRVGLVFAGATSAAALVCSAISGTMVWKVPRQYTSQFLH